MTIQLNSEQEESLHLSLSETKLLQMCNVQTLTSANRKKILSLLDKALPELVATFLEESGEVQALLPKSNNPPGFKPVFVALGKPLALWGEANEELPDGTVDCFPVEALQRQDPRSKCLCTQGRPQRSKCECFRSPFAFLPACRALRKAKIVNGWLRLLGRMS